MRLDAELQTERAYLHRYFLDHNQGRTPTETQKYLARSTCDPILANFSLLLGYTSTFMEEEESMRNLHETLGTAIEAHGSIVGTAELCARMHVFLMTYMGRLQQHSHMVADILFAVAKSKVALVAVMEENAFRVLCNAMILTVACVAAIVMARRNTHYGPPILTIVLAGIFVTSVRFLANDPLARADRRVLQALDALWSGFSTHIEPTHLAITHLHSAISLLVRVTA
jgi:hypothetical protein